MEAEARSKAAPGGESRECRLVRCNRQKIKQNEMKALKQREKKEKQMKRRKERYARDRERMQTEGKEGEERARSEGRRKDSWTGAIREREQKEKGRKQKGT